MNLEGRELYQVGGDVGEEEEELFGKNSSDMKA